MPAEPTESGAVAPKDDLPTGAGPRSSLQSSLTEQLTDPRRDYFDQLFPEQPLICGRRMKPLSIGRYRLLAHLGCAFCADEPRVATAGDLLLGVVVCSMGVQEFKDFAEQADFRKQVHWLGERVGFYEPSFLAHPFLWLYRKAWPEDYDRRDAEYLQGELLKFRDYIEKNSRAPEYWDETETGRVSACHWSQSIESVLRGGQNWQKKEIDEEPLGKAIWDFFKHMENQGLVSLMTREEIEEAHGVVEADEEEIQRQARNAEIIAKFLEKSHEEGTAVGPQEVSKK